MGCQDGYHDTQAVMTAVKVSRQPGIYNMAQIRKRCVDGRMRLALLFLTCLLFEKHRHKRRRCWTRLWITRRLQLCFGETLIEELLAEDTAEFLNSERCFVHVWTRYSILLSGEHGTACHSRE